ncbi:MAG: class C sortase [Clostridiales bacterium]|nr:class C sortase [Clostridiales bacterium]
MPQGEYNNNLDLSMYDAFSSNQPKADEIYYSLLNFDDSGIMGYIEIPKINVRLAIYHGTESDVLQYGLGHLAGTSLPVGGEGTNCVLSGHRGLPSALLLTDLDRLTYGDKFYIHILGETHAYEVDSILTVLPEDTSALEIEEGEDLITLVTCTPFGINTRRLLVRGRRTELEEEPEVSKTAQVMRSIGWKGRLAAALAVLIAVLLIFKKRISKRE